MNGYLYLNLAIAVGTRYFVTRDNHLLDLMTEKPEIINFPLLCSRPQNSGPGGLSSRSGFDAGVLATCVRVELSSTPTALYVIAQGNALGKGTPTIVLSPNGAPPASMIFALFAAQTDLNE